MLNILLTGASGRLGRPMFAGLVAAGHSVVGTDLNPPPDPPGRFIQADLMNADAVASLMDGRDAVVHLGNHSHPNVPIPDARLYLDNVTMNTHVFQAAADAGITRVVYSSSIQVIAGDRRSDETDRPSCLNSLPLDGWTRPCPGSGYALSKLAGEDFLKLLAHRHPERSFTAIRYPYLPDSDGTARAGRHGPIRPGKYSLADEAYTYLTKPDAVTLVLAVLDKALPGYHQYLPSGGNYLGLNTAEMLERFYPDVPLAAPAGENTRLVDISRITEDLGWEPKEVDIFGPCPGAV